MNQDASLTIAHWVQNLTYPVHSADDWCKLVERQLARAAADQVDILLLPEYVSEQWIHYIPENIPLKGEIAWMAEQAPAIISVLQSMVKKTGVALVAGSIPWKLDDGRYVNRAWMLFPDRESSYHDKLVLTPSEKDPESWCLDIGKAVNVVTWRGLRLAMLICLDIEMPSLSNKLADYDIDLLLIPSMTEKRSGYYRVFGCAKARAIELMTAIAVVGNVGAAKKAGNPRYNFSSGAAVYIPCEEIFGFTGIHSDLPVHDFSEGEGQILVSRNIPVDKIRAIRHGNPEVWPGPWSAKDIEISG